MIHMEIKVGLKGKHIPTGRDGEITKIENEIITFTYKENNKLKNMQVKEKYIKTEFHFVEQIETKKIKNKETGLYKEVVTFIPKLYDKENKINYTPIIPFIKYLSENYKNFIEDITDYNNSDDCLEYLFRYGFVNALSSMLAFKKLFEIKPNIKEILVIGDGNNVDLLGLKMFDRNFKDVNYTSIDKCRWINRINVIPSDSINRISFINIDIKSNEFYNLNFAKYDLILFSRILNYKESTYIKHKLLKNIFKKVNEGALIADIAHMEIKNKSFFNDYTQLELNVFELDCLKIYNSPIYNQVKQHLWNIYKSIHNCPNDCKGIEDKIFYCNTCENRNWKSMPQTALQSFKNKTVYNKLRCVKKSNDKLIDVL